MTPELHQDCEAAKELGKVAFIAKIPFDAARDQDFVIMLNNTIKKHNLSQTPGVLDGRMLVRLKKENQNDRV